MIVKRPNGKYSRLEDVGSGYLAVYEECELIENAMATGYMVKKLDVTLEEWVKGWGVEILPITPETLSRGDVIIGGVNRERMTVQGRVGDIIFHTFEDADHHGTNTVAELKRRMTKLDEEIRWEIEQPTCDKCGK